MRNASASAEVFLLDAGTTTPAVVSGAEGGTLRQYFNDKVVTRLRLLDRELRGSGDGFLQRRKETMRCLLEFRSPSNCSIQPVGAFEVQSLTLQILMRLPGAFNDSGVDSTRLTK